MSVSVEICSGTACYIMGGAHLLTVEDELSADELEKVTIAASTCMGVCSECAEDSPFARVNGKLISKANMELLVDTIREAIKLEEVERDR
jgi:NADH:ubiquinone oxidoreductase subunit E